MSTKAMTTAGSQVYLANMLLTTPVALLIPQLKGISPVGGGPRKKIDVSNMDSFAYDEFYGGRASPPETSSEIVLDLTNPGHQQCKALFEAGAQGTIGNIPFFVGLADAIGVAGVYSGGLLLPPSTGTILPPAMGSTSTATTGGTLTAGTYYYVVTAKNSNGETIASTEVSQVTTGSTSTVTVPWTAVTGATGYNIYRSSTTGAETFLATVSGGSTATYTDTGAVTPTSATAPTVNGTGVWARSGHFGLCYIADISAKGTDNDVWRADFKLQVTGKTSWANKGDATAKTY